MPRIEIHEAVGDGIVVTARGFTETTTEDDMLAVVELHTEQVRLARLDKDALEHCRACAPLPIATDTNAAARAIIEDQAAKLRHAIDEAEESARLCAEADARSYQPDTYEDR
jgi:hypothetical protein